VDDARVFDGAPESADQAVDLKSRPQEVGAGADAQDADHRHPDAGHDVYATLGEGTDATPLALTAAQQGVEAEGEGDETGEDKEQASC
jgi:hypothetical protein